MGASQSTPGQGQPARKQSRKEARQVESRKEVRQVEPLSCQGEVRFPAATKLPWNPAKAAKLYEFEPLSSRRSPISWHVGKQSPEDFAADLLDSRAKFIKGSSVKVYFRINDEICARRAFSSESGFSLLKLLQVIHSAAQSGAVLALKNSGMQKVCGNHVAGYLSNKTVRSLYLTSDQVYVNVR